MYSLSNIDVIHHYHQIKADNIDFKSK